MSGAPKRLSKVARELNVGITTIVDFLSGKGIEIDAKPNTKINDDTYQALLNEYMPDKAAKEKSQELKRNKVVRTAISLEEKFEEEEKVVEPEQEEIIIKSVASPVEEKREETQPVEEKVEQETPKEVEAPKEETVAEDTPKPETVETVKENVESAPDVTPETVKTEAEADTDDKPNVKIEELHKEIEDGPTVVGKIDLDSLNLKTRPDSRKKKQGEEKKKEAPAKKVEEVKKPEVVAKETKKEEAPAKKVEPVVEKPKEEPKPVQAEEKNKEPELIRAKVKKLDGPTVLGKIELPVSQPKGKKKPVASSSDKKETERPKKKRKRIPKHDEVDVKKEAKRNDGDQKKGNDQKQGGANRNQGGNRNQQGQGGNRNQGNRNQGNRNQGNRNQRRGAGNRNQPKPQLTEKDIQKEIKDTLARLSGGGKSKSSKFRRAKRDAVAQQKEEEMAKMEAEKSVIKVTEFVTVSELATMMSVSVNEVISACMMLGMMVSINQRLDAETLSIVAEEFGYKVEFTDAEIEETQEEEEVEDEADMVSRPPIITVMGHVDHGKTSLLDYVRKANVIAGEAGGITQHIGAYSVQLEDGREITFLDTPGHEAFTAMRARGAQVTDLAIIVIAADDSVMPQTKEAINHAQAAGVPMIFAFNKIDKPGANADKIREELAAMDILVEDWGGKFQCQEISAKKGQGIDELLDKVLLEAEMLELKANPDRRAVGTVIEASLDKGRGYVTTLLVQKGTLRVGDLVVAGSYFAKVKAMFNERGAKISEAGPSHPVSMLGFNGAPNAGDGFKEFEEEREAKQLAVKREQLQREQGIRTQKHITLDEIGRRLALGDFQELNVIVKGDVDGSVEALSDSLMKLSTETIQVNVIHKSVGQITESDVLLATASDAIIIGFQVRPSGNARKLAEKEEIDIRMYSVIYKAIEELKDAMEGMLKPKFEEQIVCNIEIRETFKISKVGTIAGCYVLDGKVNRNTRIRLIREGVVKYSGELGSLKRFKDDVKEVAAGYECGLNIHNYNDIKVGDIIEGYEEVEIKQKL